jgi:hypothetical protein
LKNLQRFDVDEGLNALPSQLPTILDVHAFEFFALSKDDLNAMVVDLKAPRHVQDFHYVPALVNHS